MKYFYDKITQEMKDKMKSGEFRSVLFCGAQGTGKSFAARKLQEELETPIKIVEVETRYLGQAIKSDEAPERKPYSNEYFEAFKGTRIYITSYKQIQANRDKFDLIIKG